MKAAHPPGSEDAPVSQTPVADELRRHKERLQYLEAALTEANSERERLAAERDAQSEYAIKLQRLIESLRHDGETPYPELHHHAIVKDARDTAICLTARVAALRAVAKEAYEMSPLHSNGCAGTTKFEEGVIHDNTKGCDCYLSRLRAAALDAGDTASDKEGM